MALDEFGLTLKQRIFADEYIINHGNASEAYRKAGYSAKVTAAGASEILRNPKVQAYIAMRTAEAKSKRTMDVTEALERLASIARGEKQRGVSNSVEKVENGNGKSSTKKRAKTYEYTPDSHDQLSAIDTILKVNGAFNESLNVKLELPTFVDDVPEDD
ncbi:terminase small subunit [Periweissella cryptocerci]|uniref:Terminase small subunit n=1 Tax=Periweissella cryptocerci TaxID=2506420 RepID=A0A4P6YRX1_9LACO|nr:terminase small subunit [Periweissella cryptocerci]QBO35391.1 terminase small subunit [Periweissella cryptocerci]